MLHTLSQCARVPCVPCLHAPMASAGRKLLTERQLLQPEAGGSSGAQPGSSMRKPWHALLPAHVAWHCRGHPQEPSEVAITLDCANPGNGAQAPPPGVCLRSLTASGPRIPGATSLLPGAPGKPNNSTVPGRQQAPEPANLKQLLFKNPKGVSRNSITPLTEWWSNTL